MTPFFRNIRKKMADDNKPMKYVRYAIGEILLVSCSQIPPKWKRSDINVKGIESSDNLGRIKNEKLKQLLYNWFGINENVKAMEQSGEDAFLTYINYIKENGSWREIDKLANFGNAISGGSILMPDNDHLLLDYKFENVVDDHLAWLLNRNREYRATRVHLEKIINETD